MWYPPEQRSTSSRSYSLQQSYSTRDSLINCQNHFDVPRSNCYDVPISTGSYVDEMSSYPTTIHRTSVTNVPLKNNFIPRLTSAGGKTRWDWLLFPPDYYSDLYTPSSICVSSLTLDDSLPLDSDFLSRFSLTSNFLLTSSDDENDNETEFAHLRSKSAISQSTEIFLDEQSMKLNRSSSPDTDDGYQSASDASRSDSSHSSSLPMLPILPDRLAPQDESRSILEPTRLSYAAAAKPLANPKANSSNASPSRGKHQQLMKNSLSTIIDNPENGTATMMMMTTTTGQKCKFIAPRFERMHHAKQTSASVSTATTKNPSSNTSANRTSNRSNANHSVRSQTMNSTRRR